MASIVAIVSAFGGTLPSQNSRANEGPLRLIGEIPARLERAKPQIDGAIMLTLFLGDVRQPIDRGDELRIFDPESGRLLTTAEVTGDTRTDGHSGRVHVRANLARPTEARRLAELAPSRHPGFPDALAARDPFVLQHGPKVTVVAPFEPEEGDDPANFVRIVDTATNESIVGARNVTPHASYELQFSKPIDISTLQRVQMTAKHVAGEVPMRVSSVDADGTTFRFAPPLGLAFLPQMRKQALDDRNLSPAKRRPHYHLRIAADDNGVCATTGEKLELPFELPITINPEAEDNLVRWRTFRVR